MQTCREKLGKTRNQPLGNVRENACAVAENIKHLCEGTAPRRGLFPLEWAMERKRSRCAPAVNFRFPSQIMIAHPHPVLLANRICLSNSPLQLFALSTIANDGPTCYAILYHMVKIRIFQNIFRSISPEHYQLNSGSSTV